MREHIQRGKERLSTGIKYLIAGLSLCVLVLAGAMVYDRFNDSKDSPIAPTGALSGNEGVTWHRSVTTLKPPTDVYLFGERLPLENWDIRERFEREFYYNYTNADQLLLWWKRGQKYFPQIEQILTESDVPADAKYLMVAESGLRNVKSPASAHGFWQFIPETGKRYGLRVTDAVDERLDPVKATVAAAHYLKDIKRDVPSWTLVAASYNMGEAGVRNAMDQQQQETYWNLWASEETMRYVFRIAAIKELMEHGDRYGLDFQYAKGFQLPQSKVVSVQGPVSDLASWSVAQGYTYKDIRVFNPWITGKSLPAGSWQVAVPASKEDRASVEPLEK